MCENDEPTSRNKKTRDPLNDAFELSAYGDVLEVIIAGLECYPSTIYRKAAAVGSWPYVRIQAVVGVVPYACPRGRFGEVAERIRDGGAARLRRGAEATLARIGAHDAKLERARGRAVSGRCGIGSRGIDPNRAVRNRELPVAGDTQPVT